MNQTSEDVQHSFVYLHAVHTQNNIYPLTFQDNETGREHSPDKLKWDLRTIRSAATWPLGVLMEYVTLVAHSISLAL
jgi:hypothetical protein